MVSASDKKQGDKPAKRRLTTFGRIVLGLFAVYFLVTMNPRSLGLPIGHWPQFPRHVFTTTKATLTFNGEQVFVEGTTWCTRRSEKDENGDTRWWVLLPMHFGYMYTCGPQWIGHRFDDGSALLVGAYSYRSPRLKYRLPPRGQRHFSADSTVENIAQLPPAVIWLDNAEEPTRAEYYFSATAFDDPRSRLTEVDYEIEMWAASAWTRLFTWRSETDPTGTVPFRDAPFRRRSLAGHFFIEYPKEVWSELPAVAAAVADLHEPTIFNPWHFLPEGQARALGGLAAEAKHSVPKISTSVVRASARDAGHSDEPRSAGTQPPEPFTIYPLAYDGESFRVSRDGPHGMLLMYLVTESIYRDINFGPSEIEFDGDFVSADSKDLWRGRLLYDPESGSLFRGDFVIFSNRDLR
ncbi:MAG: hypothetical protein Kow00114_21070 [Kiloniellaceae bacterium]